MQAETRGVITLNELRNRSHVFRDRAHAGEVLAGMLAHRRGGNAVVLGIPAGGVPVAAVIARQLQWPLDVAVVSKITLPWNTEAGYGAVAFDGSVRLNEALIARVALSRHMVEAGIGRTREKVERRAQLLRHDKPFPDLNRLGVILVDDGLASGFTLETALAALRRLGSREIIVAVPTAHADTAQRVAAEVEALYCPNIREGFSFAVADAYEDWHDVTEDTVLALLQESGPPH
jgi:predicted phosphoribosyltransferase